MKHKTNYALFLMMSSLATISGLISVFLFFFAENYHPETATYFLGWIVGLGFAAILVKDDED